MGGTRSFDLGRGFMQKGYDVETITSTSETKYSTKNRWVTIEKLGLTVHYIYLPYTNDLTFSKRVLVFLQFLWYSTFKLLSIKCDMVLATSTPLTIAIPALIKKW